MRVNESTVLRLLINTIPGGEPVHNTTMAHIVLVLGTILLCVVLNFATEIENPGFFLKVTKNVPRIGRRSEGGQSVTDFDTFFLKASKSVPRIGRSHIVSISLFVYIFK